MENPEAPKRHGWSIVRKTQVIGALASVLITIGILFLPGSIYSFSGLLAILTMAPAILVAKAFGKPMHWSVNDKTGGPAVFPFCLIIITNAFLGFSLERSSVG
jgi:hypothetical protein